MLPLRVRLRSLMVNRFELLLPVLVVAVPVQLSPPAMNTLSPAGSTSCELQKRSVPVPLLKVRWLPSFVSHTS